MILNGKMCNLWEYIGNQTLAKILCFICGKQPSSDYEYFKAFCEHQKDLIGNKFFMEAMQKINILFPNVTKNDFSINSEELWIQSNGIEPIFPNRSDKINYHKISIEDIAYIDFPKNSILVSWNKEDIFVRPNPYNIQKNDEVVNKIQKIRNSMLNGTTVYLQCDENITMLQDFLKWKSKIAPLATIYLYGKPCIKIARIALEHFISLWIPKKDLCFEELQIIASEYPFGKIQFLNL